MDSTDLAAPQFGQGGSGGVQVLPNQRGGGRQCEGVIFGHGVTRGIHAQVETRICAMGEFCGENRFDACVSFLESEYEVSIQSRVRHVRNKTKEIVDSMLVTFDVDTNSANMTDPTLYTYLVYRLRVWRRIDRIDKPGVFRSTRSHKQQNYDMKERVHPSHNPAFLISARKA